MRRHMGTVSTTRPLTASRLLTLLAVTAVMVVAACSSSGSKSGSSATTGSSSSGSTGSASGADQAGLAWANKLISDISKRPTKLPQAISSAPLSAAPARGKRIAYISCNLDTCSSYIPVIKTIASSLGWSVTVFTSDGSAESTKQQWDNALRLGYNGIIFTIPTDLSGITSELREAETRHIPTTTSLTTAPIGNGFTFKAGDAATIQALGTDMAAEAIAKSGAKAKALILNFPSQPVLQVETDAITSTFKDHCTSCQVDKIDISISQIAKDVPNIVTSYLRAHPGVDWVLPTVASMVNGMPSAFSAAGIHGVHFATAGSEPANLANVKDGVVDAHVFWASVDSFYAQFNTLVRYFANDPPITNVVLPEWLITKDTTVDSVTQPSPAVHDIAQQYARLWHLS